MVNSIRNISIITTKSAFSFIDCTRFERIENITLNSGKHHMNKDKAINIFISVDFICLFSFLILFSISKLIHNDNLMH